MFPLFNSSTTSLCAGFSFLSALSYTLNLGTDQLRQTGEPLTVLIQKASKLNRPIVLFIEGTKTNGTGILEFPSKVGIFRVSTCTNSLRYLMEFHRQI